MSIRNVVFILLLLLRAGSACADTSTVWIGMSTPVNGEKEGIYRSTLDVEKGTLTRPTLAAEIRMPEFLALDPNGKQLYSACLFSNGEGGVAAYEIANDERSLRLLNTMPTGGGESCHVAVDRSGKCLLSAHYGGGNVSVLPIAADGRIQSYTSLIRHVGSGPNAARQEGPHPHFVGTDPANRFVFVPDLGTDKVVIYDFNPETATLKPHGAGKCPPGSGPRHFAFHPNGKFAYVVNEMAITVTAFRFDAATGTLEAIQTIDALPEKDRKLPSTAAEIYIHPSGRFLYTSNRNDDTITVFRVDPVSGRLTFVEREPIRGSHPRSFNLDPSGKWLLAAGRDSNTLAVFRIDADTGKLVYTNQIVSTPAPICVLIEPAH